jgi:hypothetical protein
MKPKNNLATFTKVQSKFLSHSIARKIEFQHKVQRDVICDVMWSISPTFYERICANILEPKKDQT